MRAALCAALCALLPLSALAGSEDFGAALDVGAWSGCVEQDGYAPYPIQLLAADDDTFSVEYSGACMGIHTPVSSAPHDAMETIEIGANICIPSIKVIYNYQSDHLRLTFIDRNQLNAIAVLTPQTSNKPADCAPKDLTS